MKKILAFALILIGVSAVAAIAADSKSTAGNDGRYHIINTTISMPGPVKYDLSQPVLVDSQTGSTWILAQPEGQQIGWYPLVKSDKMPAPAPAPAAPAATPPAKQ